MISARGDIVFTSSWIALAIVGVAILAFGVVVTVMQSPGETPYLRAVGVASIGMGLFGFLITVIAYRRRERWAWFALWYYPVFWIAHLAGRLPPGKDRIHQAVFIVLALAGLLLPLRQFFPRRWLELKVPPPAVALVIGVAMWLAARYGASLDLPFAVRIVAFSAFALAGGAIAIAAELAFKRARTTLNPFRPQNSTALVTSGIYRFTRNPMYVGLTLVVIGWAAFLCSAWALLGPPAFVLYINRFQIAPEERALSGKFADPYREYTSRVPRWLWRR